MGQNVDRTAHFSSFNTIGLTDWWGAGVVICLEWGADFHMAQLLPLPLTDTCFSKIQIGFTFLVPAHLGSPGKGPLNGCVCVGVSWLLRSESAFVVTAIPAAAVASQAVSDGRAQHRQFDLMRQQLRRTRAEMRRRDWQIAEQARKIADQERALAELNRRIVEYDQRFDDIATEVAHVRAADIAQKHVSPSSADTVPKHVASSASSTASLSSESSLPKQTATEGRGSSLPKQSTSHAAAEISTACQLSASASDHSCSVATNAKKRTALPLPRKSKHSRKSGGPAAAASGNVCCLRSGRKVVWK